MAILKNTSIANSGFFKLPVGTTAQRPPNPEIGMCRYNSNDKEIEFFDGTGWYSNR